MRFWLGVSTMFSAVLLTTPSGGADQHNVSPVLHPLTRSNESRLAGLLPGRTAISTAENLLGKASIKDTDNRSIVWQSCMGDELIVDLDDRGIVQLIRAVKSLRETRKVGCENENSSASKWTTGKGLRVGSSARRVLQLYGEPDSRSPSTKDGQRLELLYYAFDWAGPDVPQVMEVLCTMEKDGKPGKVVEITLAASSL
jgi:hypothetical protein